MQASGRPINNTQCAQ